MDLIYLDTCVLLDIVALYNEENVDLFHTFSKFRLGLTQALRSEYANYALVNLPNLHFDFQSIISAPEKQQYISHHTLQNFDNADIELFIVAHRDKSVVITNDRSLYLCCFKDNLRVFYLYEFLIAIISQGILPKKILYQCWRYWQKIARFPKATLKEIKTQFHQLQ